MADGRNFHIGHRKNLALKADALVHFRNRFDFARRYIGFFHLFLPAKDAKNAKNQTLFFRVFSRLSRVINSSNLKFVVPIF
jgi:hypothetical protein